MKEGSLSFIYVVCADDGKESDSLFSKAVRFSDQSEGLDRTIIEELRKKHPGQKLMSVVKVTFSYS